MDENDSNTSDEENKKDEFKKQISTMSFEELQQLKEQIGAKIYNETVFGVKGKKKTTNEYKRANKNRPREESSKKRVKNLNNVIPVKKQTPRDPRFDPLCGTYDHKEFKANYKFLKDLKQKDRKKLEKEYEDTTDPQRKKKIKLLMQRMENQILEQEKHEKLKQEMQKEKKEIKEKLKHGEKPVFKKKSDKNIEMLINKYEELKKSNKLQKHIEKRNKKLAKKQFKNVNNTM